MDQLYDYVVNGAAVPEKPVVLTFDDGYADTYSIVYPLMKEYGFAATVFVNPGDVGTRLTWEQLKEMKDNGITISNHGFQHVEMGQLSKAAQMENIQKAQQALADKLGITDNPWFCYPYGDKNKDTDAATKDSGIKMAMAMKSGWAHTGDNPYNILRVWVGNAVDIKHFEERISTEHYSDL
jgi:polysaccharide deacetylase